MIPATIASRVVPSVSTRRTTPATTNPTAIAGGILTENGDAPNTSTQKCRKT